MILTVLVKTVLFPLANKSYRAMNKMKKLGPQMQELRTRLGEDKVRLNQEMMALYKREKVNPAAGCLPMFVQIPVFIALYQVLYVTIEMRQAPFFGWIRDLSVPDPTSVLNLFGLLPYAVPNLGPLHHPQHRRLAARPGRHHVPAAEDEPAAARSGAGEDLHVSADHVHVHDGAVSGRAGDLLVVEQPAGDRAAMAAQAHGRAPRQAGAEAAGAEAGETAGAEAAEAAGAQVGKAELGRAAAFTAS